MAKIDLKKSELKAFYRASPKKVVQVTVPEFDYLMVDGQGDPNVAPQYAQAIEALYAVSYAAKFAVRKGSQAVDYAVMPLQGLWWDDDMAAFARQDKASWRWTMMKPDRQTPRDISERCAACGAVKLENHHSPAHDADAVRALGVADRGRRFHFTEASCNAVADGTDVGVC